MKKLLSQLRNIVSGSHIRMYLGGAVIQEIYVEPLFCHA